MSNLTASDLRIGNIIYLQGLAVKVSPDTILRIHTNSGMFKDQYSGIPLTEEILEKCGFKKRGDSGGGPWYWAGQIINLTQDLTLSTATRDYDSEEVSSSNPVKFLHQLQNLVYSLTGNDMKLDMN